MSSPEFEAFLARLYTDAGLRERLAADPAGEAQRAGLSLEQGAALAAIDWTGLGFAARSFDKKRAAKKERR